MPIEYNEDYYKLLTKVVNFSLRRRGKEKGYEYRPRKEYIHRCCEGLSRRTTHGYSAEHIFFAKGQELGWLNRDLLMCSDVDKAIHVIRTHYLTEAQAITFIKMRHMYQKIMPPVTFNWGGKQHHWTDASPKFEQEKAWMDALKKGDQPDGTE